VETSEKIAWLSLLVNAALVGIKASLATFSGSLAIKADAIHSLSDVVSSAVTLTGIRIARRRARGFPYGLYKVENLVALGTSFLISYAGYEIVREVFLGSAEILPSTVPVSVGGIFVVMLVTGIFSRYELRKGRETTASVKDSVAGKLAEEMRVYNRDAAGFPEEALARLGGLCSTF
jgi:cation diffusion facilitator family transporter